MRSKIIYFLFSILFCNIVNAQSNFERSYLQVGLKQYGVSIAELNGKFYVTSISDNCGLCVSTECLTQLDQNGNIIQTNYFSRGTNDEVVGELTSYGNGFVFPVTYDHFTPTITRKQVEVKYVDSFGFEIWSTIISDSLKDLQNMKLVIGSDNLITGFADDITSGGVIFFRIDSSGNVFLKQNFSILPDVYSVRDLVLKNNYFYVLGIGVVGAATKTFVRKIGLTGNVIDSIIYDYATEISGVQIKTYNDGFLICGQTYDTLGFTQVSLMNIDSSGNIIWNKTLTTSDDNIATSFEIFDNGKIYITGKTIDQSNNVSLFIISTDSGGNFLWENHYCLPGASGCLASVGNSIIESSDHSIVVCGQVQYLPATPNLYILKADTNGLINFINPISVSVDKPFIKKQTGSDLVSVENVLASFMVCIFDMNGRMIVSKINETEFNFRFAEGIYIYRIQTKSGVYTGRLF